MRSPVLSPGLLHKLSSRIDRWLKTKNSSFRRVAFEASTGGGSVRGGCEPQKQTGRNGQQQGLHQLVQIPLQQTWGEYNILHSLLLLTHY